MIIFLRKRTLYLMFGGLFFIGISLGAYKMAAHPEMKNWVEQRVVITHIETEEKVVALSFDDGPDPSYTPLVLDALKKHKVKGTFFVMGKRAEQNPLILQRIAAEGHEIGNHSYSHPDFNHKSRSFLLSEIEKTNQIVYRLTAQRPRLFRPPGGYLSYELVDLCKKEKLTIAYWSYIQDSKDWVNGKKARTISNYVIRHIKPGQIILLHDGCPNGRETARAADMIIESLQKEGYRFVTMSELIQMENSE